jgi:hypothetical protein
MAWLDEVGLGNDAATNSAYNMLLDAIAGGSNYHGQTGAAIAKSRAFDAAAGGAGLRGADRSAYDAGSRRNIVAAEDETKREASERSLQDQALYGQTFQKGALNNDAFQYNVEEAKRALKKEKKNQRKKKYGTMLKAIGSILSVIPVTAPIGMALAAGGQAMGASGERVVARNYKNANTSKVGTGDTLSQAGTQGRSGLAPVAQPFVNYSPNKPLNYTPAAGPRIDPLTGLPY